MSYQKKSKCYFLAILAGGGPVIIGGLIPIGAPIGGPMGGPIIPIGGLIPTEIAIKLFSHRNISGYVEG